MCWSTLRKALQVQTTVEQACRRTSASLFMLRSRSRSFLRFEMQGLTVAISHDRKLRAVSAVMLHSDSCTCAAKRTCCQSPDTVMHARHYIGW